MVQHSKPTEDLNKAVEDIETAYKQYTASVNRALTIAECSFKRPLSKKVIVRQHI